ncbi:hypothetical protein ACTFIY_004570 [Dictyostelium cf. discoideum]
MENNNNENINNNNENNNNEINNSNNENINNNNENNNNNNNNGNNNNEINNNINDNNNNNEDEEIIITKKKRPRNNDNKNNNNNENNNNNNNENNNNNNNNENNNNNNNENNNNNNNNNENNNNYESKLSLDEITKIVQDKYTGDIKPTNKYIKYNYYQIIYRAFSFLEDIGVDISRWNRHEEELPKNVEEYLIRYGFMESIQVGLFVDFIRKNDLVSIGLDEKYGVPYIFNSKKNRKCLVSDNDAEIVIRKAHGTKHYQQWTMENNKDEKI